MYLCARLSLDLRTAKTYDIDYPSITAIFVYHAGSVPSPVRPSIPSSFAEQHQP